jgi:hypothetical protein
MAMISAKRWTPREVVEFLEAQDDGDDGPFGEAAETVRLMMNELIRDKCRCVKVMINEDGERFWVFDESDILGEEAP